MEKIASGLGTRRGPTTFDAGKAPCYYELRRKTPSHPTSPRRLAWPRTSPFHGGNTGSNPVGDAKVTGVGNEAPNHLMNHYVRRFKEAPFVAEHESFGEERCC